MTEPEDLALDAWTPLPPPADFVDRVMAQYPVVMPPPRPSRRWLYVGGVATAAAIVFVLVQPHRATTGALVARERVTQALGDRGLAVAEADTELTWRIDDRGAADLTQRTGNVFYRVERGEPFVVHTPAGDVRVTGTCFRIEVAPMHSTTKLVTAGLAGAAIASAVLITVYEGHVVAETRTARTELAAGGSATLHPDGAPAIATRAALPPAVDPDHATRDELLAYTRQQEAQLATLRTQVAALEHGAPKDDPNDPDHPWYQPSAAQLAAWVSECRVRSDQPSLEMFSPVDDPRHVRGLRPSELDAYNATLTEMATGWKTLVRRLYIEVTGDTAGADTLSAEAMRKEIDDKSPPGEHNNVLQKIAQERAGLAAPPTDVSKASPVEQLVRAYTALGDQTEAGLAKRIGADRAHALRGNA